MPEADRINIALTASIFSTVSVVCFVAVSLVSHETEVWRFLNKFGNEFTIAQ